MTYDLYGETKVWVRQWMNDRCDTTDVAIRTPIADLYFDFMGWLRVRSSFQTQRKVFGDVLYALGIQDVRKYSKGADLRGGIKIRSNMNHA